MTWIKRNLLIFIIMPLAAASLVAVGYFLFPERYGSIMAKLDLWKGDPRVIILGYPVLPDEKTEKALEECGFDISFGGCVLNDLIIQFANGYNRTMKKAVLNHFECKRKDRLVEFIDGLIFNLPVFDKEQLTRRRFNSGGYTSPFRRPLS